MKSPDLCQDIRLRMIEMAKELKVVSSMNEMGGLSLAQIEVLIDSMIGITEAISQLIRKRNEFQIRRIIGRKKEKNA